MITKEYWANFTLPHSTGHNGESFFSSISLTRNEPRSPEDPPISESFIKAIGAFMAGEGYTPSDVQRMSKEEVYDHLVKPGSESTLQALLVSQGVAIVSWEIIETGGSAHALEAAREMTRSRAETLIKEKARPRMNILH